MRQLIRYSRKIMTEIQGSFGQLRSQETVMFIDK